MQKDDLYRVDPSELSWRKSRFTNSEQCFELAPLPGGGVAVRDSKHPRGPHLCFDRGEWQAFRAGLAAGDFDDL